MDSKADQDAAEWLAKELDAYLDGDMTMHRVGAIEGCALPGRGLVVEASGI
jgi:hypothetical protein